MTAYHCVLMDGPVEGRTVLVQGGAGAVGHFAVQLAAWGGARVLATVDSEEKARHAARGGASATIDFRREPVAERVLELTAGAGVDRVVEVDFGGNLVTDLQLLAPNGTIVAYASRGNGSPVLPFYDLLRRNLSVRAVYLPGTPLASRHAAQRGVGAWMKEGHAQITVSASFGLDDTAAAHEAVESGTKLGTVVVVCS